MKRLDLNDPKLTAFALGELDGQEAIEMAKLVENDPDAKKYVDEMRTMSAVISSELQSEAPAPSTPLRLMPEEREKIFTAQDKVSWWKSWTIIVPAASFGTVAAVIVAVVIAQPYIAREAKMMNAQVTSAPNSESTHVAMNSEPQRMGGLVKEAKLPPSAASNVASDKSQTLADASMEMDYADEGSPSDDLEVSKPGQPRQLTSPKQGGALKLAESGKSAKKNVSKDGLFSVFGGGAGGVNEKLAQSTSGSGELMGMADESIGAAPASRQAIPIHGQFARGKGIDPGFGGARREDVLNSGRISAQPPPPPAAPAPSRERYSPIQENEFVRVADEPLSTFSIDVDTASYANVRRILNEDRIPPADSVRIEEMLNSFKYNYPQPKDGRPFSVNTEIAESPFNKNARIVQIGLKGKEISDANRPASNLVFLLDVSGSMDEPNKLPLVKKSMELLVEKMREKDRIAIVTYAGAEGIALESTSGSNKKKILESIETLSAGGSTNGEAGINAAYTIAQKHFIKDGINRIVLATDGDFNVGPSSDGELEKLIEQKAKSGVFLTVLGFGSGNVNDSMMVKLAGKGNGNYGYIDSLHEARKLLVEQAGGTLQTIAKDVKIQIEFNPNVVNAYRLIGYEKRMLAKEDFNDDQKDAGEIGAGHTVTALYEVIPVGSEIPAARPPVDQLKYQPTPVKTAESAPADPAKSTEMMTVKLRYKKPTGDKSELFDHPVKNESQAFSAASTDLKFASAVAGFGMNLRNSKFKGEMTLDNVIELASSNSKVGGRMDDNRLELIELARKAKRLSSKNQKPES